MNKTFGFIRFGLVPALAFSALRSYGQIDLMDSQEPQTVSIEDNFRTGWREAQAGTGVYFSNIFKNSNRPVIDYAVAYGQMGYMITAPGSQGWWRGNLEVAPELFGAGIYHGPGDYIVGGTLWFRYNFVQPGWKFVPYLQGGGGATVINLPHNYDGKDFNFNLEAAVGLHYFIHPTLALNLEYRFQHISNANLWSHNIGANADGPALGLSFFF